MLSEMPVGMLNRMLSRMLNIKCLMKYLVEYLVECPVKCSVKSISWSSERKLYIEDLACQGDTPLNPPVWANASFISKIWHIRGTPPWTPWFEIGRWRFGGCWTLESIWARALRHDEVTELYKKVSSSKVSKRIIYTLLTCIRPSLMNWFDCWICWWICWMNYLMFWFCCFDFRDHVTATFLCTNQKLAWHERIFHTLKWIL